MKKKFEYPRITRVALNFRENIADSSYHIYAGNIDLKMSGPGADHTFVASGLSCGPYHGSPNAFAECAAYYADFIRNNLMSQGIPAFFLTDPQTNFIMYLQPYGCVSYL